MYIQLALLVCTNWYEILNKTILKMNISDTNGRAIENNWDSYRFAYTWWQSWVCQNVDKCSWCHV